MWPGPLHAKEQGEVSTEWVSVLDAMRQVHVDNGRALSDSTQLAKLQACCKRIHKRGFSPLAVALQLHMDLRTGGLLAVGQRILSIASFLDANTNVLEHADQMSGDSPEQLLEAMASKAFLLPLCRSCRGIKSFAGVVVGLGRVGDEDIDQYTISGTGYSFELVEAADTEYVSVFEAASELQSAVADLQKRHGFHVSALTVVLREILNSLGPRLPGAVDEESGETKETVDGVAESVEVASTVSELPGNAVSSLKLIADASLDAWERPYLEAASTIFDWEAKSLTDALSRVALLPPALEPVGELIGEELVEHGASCLVPALKGQTSVEGVFAELERRGTHRLTRAFLRRAMDLATQDDATRIRALIEDRERWRRVVLGRIPSIASLQSESVESIEAATAVESPDNSANSLKLIADASLDAWDRPYLEAASTVFDWEGKSLVVAVSKVALLPPALEPIGELIGDELVEHGACCEVPPLKGQTSLEGVFAELTRRGTHRLTRAFLRRAMDLATQDDATRIQALVEDRERWHRVVEGRITSIASLHMRLGDLIEEWQASDPASPCVSPLRAARRQLERRIPMTDSDLSRIMSPEVSSANSSAGTGIPTGSSSSALLLAKLAKVALISPHVTANPLPTELLNRALELGRRPEAKPRINS